MNIRSETLAEGKERYKSGVIPYKKMGYWEPDYRPKDTDLIAMFESRRRPASTMRKRRRRWPVKVRPRRGPSSGPTA